MYFNSVFFIDENTGWLTGMGGWTYKTTNGGNSWIRVSTIGSFFYYDVYFINALTGWLAGSNESALGGGVILRTTNGGYNWNLQSYSRAIYSLCFPDSCTGWAVGDRGTILKTTNGGSVFVSNTKNIKPEEFSLLQNYPNPFNPTTTIPYELKVTSDVRLVVYDLLGRQVTELVGEKQNPGRYEVTFDGSNYSSGVYFYTLMTDGYIETKKMSLIK